MTWLKRWLYNRRLKYYSKDHFDVRYFRKSLEKDAKSVGETVEVWFGGAFNPVEIYRFKYLGEYKGRKVFKKITQNH